MLKVCSKHGAYLLRNVHVITGSGGELPDADVLISRERFARIAACRIDAPGAQVIDAHVYLDYVPAHGGFTAWYRTHKMLKPALREVLEAGITTIRCMADPLRFAVKLRAWAGQDPRRGPRMLVAGPALTAPGGHPAVTVAKDNPWLGQQIARSRVAGERTHA